MKNGFLLQASIVSTVLLTGAGCTQQIKDSFRYAQQEEAFSSTQDVNTKIDMLWVVDNSPSMWPSQKKIRDGFRSFADRYMKPTWDIRVAVISQDTYLAHPSFAGFLNTVATSGSASRYSRAAGFSSSYLNPSSSANPKRTTPFVTPSSWTTTAIDSSGTVTGGGVKLRHGVPDYGGADPAADVSVSNPSLWARLVPGRHDGPLSTMCWTSNSNPFFFGVTKCYVRDKQDVYSGVNDCILGGSGDLDSTVQCVNTIMNNTVRSGKAIISTLPPAGVPADATWTDQLYKDFLVNMSGGVSGYPLEQYFNSISQLITDNEAAASTTKLFRPDALRVIVIVTDEDDQSTVIPGSQITPESQYDPNASCPYKTVDGHTYRLQICPKPAQVRTVSGFKDSLDAFFRGLDGSGSTGDPNYFVVTITPKTGQVLKDLHDQMGESYDSVSSDYGTRLFEFVDSVGNGSLKLEVASADYQPLLDSIGQVIVEKKAVYVLKRPPTGQEDMIVLIRHADGSTTIILPSDYVISGNTITITDQDIVLGLTSTDVVVINYQPKTGG
jgi:hypothetical protein